MVSMRNKKNYLSIIIKYFPLSRALMYILCEYAPEEPSTLLVDIDILLMHGLTCLIQMRPCFRSKMTAIKLCQQYDMITTTNYKYTKIYIFSNPRTNQAHTSFKTSTKKSAT